MPNKPQPIRPDDVLLEEFHKPMRTSSDRKEFTRQERIILLSLLMPDLTQAQMAALLDVSQGHVAHVLVKHRGRVRQAEKAMQIEALMRENPDLKQREIAAAVGTSPGYVGTVAVKVRGRIYGRLDPKDYPLVDRLYLQNRITVEAIADRLQVSNTCVQRYIYQIARLHERYELHRGPRRDPRAATWRQIEAVKRMLKRGDSVEAIAAAVRRNPNTIRQWIAKYDLVGRNSEYGIEAELKREKAREKALRPPRKVRQPPPYLSLPHVKLHLEKIRAEATDRRRNA